MESSKLCFVAFCVKDDKEILISACTSVGRFVSDSWASCAQCRRVTDEQTDRRTHHTLRSSVTTNAVHLWSNKTPSTAAWLIYRRWLYQVCSLSLPVEHNTSAYNAHSVCVGGIGRMWLLCRCCGADALSAARFAMLTGWVGWKFSRVLLNVLNADFFKLQVALIDLA